MELQKHSDLFDQFFIDNDGHFQFNHVNGSNIFTIAIQDYTNIPNIFTSARELHFSKVFVLIPLFESIIRNIIQSFLADEEKKKNLFHYLRRLKNEDLSGFTSEIWLFKSHAFHRLY
ncbi:MAG TPA: hypothetical protein VMV49_10625 [Candidatus Deferrimicrobium sp.]|nr:hypothetical protein [Candidatus Deferrimicrobium sp.]